MFSLWLKRVIRRLPHSAQQEARRAQCWWQIRNGRFRSPEPDYAGLPHLIRRGDWVVDIGANVGHYTSRFSELAGPAGRVIAFEPIPATFEILAANSRHFPYRNTTLVNAALSDCARIAGMSVPEWAYGGPNYYRAHMTRTGGAVDVLCWAVDSFPFPHRVALIKIDVEGNAAAALRGACRLIERDRPFLIVEGEAHEFLPALTHLGYRAWKYPGSPNVLLACDWPGYEGGPEIVAAGQKMSEHPDLIYRVT